MVPTYGSRDLRPVTASQRTASAHVIANYRVRFDEPPPDTEGTRARSMRLVYLGDDDHGHALEVMAVAGKHDELLVIHAMELRDKYRKCYEDRR